MYYATYVQSTFEEYDWKATKCRVWDRKNSKRKYGFEKKKLLENSERSDINMYVKKIRKLEEDAQGDKVIMELMDRKLKEIGKEHYDYVMKIQTEADRTTKQLKEQDNTMLQTIMCIHTLGCLLI